MKIWPLNGLHCTSYNISPWTQLRESSLQFLSSPSGGDKEPGRQGSTDQTLQAETAAP